MTAKPWLHDAIFFAHIIIGASRGCAHLPAWEPGPEDVAWVLDQSMQLL